MLISAEANSYEPLLVVADGFAAGASVVVRLLPGRLVVAERLMESQPPSLRAAGS